jgi:Zn-finger nucleic acid-binding protein
MIVVEHKKIELDYCLRCAGVWFDAGELDLLVSSMAPEDSGTSSNLLSAVPARVKETRRQCPICGKTMDKVWLGKEPQILIDRCARGHGLWFDGGELQRLLREVTPGGSNSVVSFLGDAFSSQRKQAGFGTSEKLS